MENNKLMNFNLDKRNRFGLFWVSTFFFFSLSSLFADATHSIRIGGGTGIGKITLPEREEASAIDNGNALYLNLKNPGTTYPYSIISQTGKGSLNGLQQFHLQYRYEDNLRITVGYRNASARYNTKTQHLPGSIDPSQDIYNWREERKYAGLEYYFPLGDFFKIGPSVKYYDVDQTYRNKFNGFADIRTVAAGASSTNFTDNKVGTERSIGRYYGLAPGIAMEFIISESFRIGLAGEYIKLAGTKNNIFPYYSSLGTSLGSPITGMGYFSDSGAMEMKGFFGDLTIQYRPFSLLGITFGYHRENYNRRYKNYTYTTSNSESVLDNKIYTDIAKSSNAKFTSHVYYLQADLIIDF